MRRAKVILALEGMPLVTGAEEPEQDDEAEGQTQQPQQDQDHRRPSFSDASRCSGYASDRDESGHLRS
jgi:hypothetical protein